MITATNATINIGGTVFTYSRENFLSDVSQSEAALDASLQNSSVYRRDIFMFAKGDMFVNEQEFFSARDLKDIGGVLNYAQAITHRLMTTRGTHPEDVFFGVPWYDYLGQRYTDGRVTLSRLTADITEELYKDNRTQEVGYVRPEFNGRTAIFVSCAVIPVRFSSTAIELALSLEDR